MREFIALRAEYSAPQAQSVLRAFLRALRVLCGEAMRAASAELQSFLATRQPCWLAECFSIALADGLTVLNWTSFDRDLVSGGVTYTSLSPLVSRSRMSMKGTVEVPELDVTVAALDSVTVNGLSLKTAVHNGIFDGARLSLYRVWMPMLTPEGLPQAPGDTSLGLVLMFDGRLAQSEITASTVRFTAKGDNVLMNMQAPKSLYQPTCLHTFCDSGCNAAPALVNGVSTPDYMVAANFTNSFSVGGPFPSSTQIPWASAPANPGLYILGSVTFASGVGHEY